MWFKYFLILFFFLGSITEIMLIGKVREPIKPLEAAIGVIIKGLIIYGILHYF